MAADGFFHPEARVELVDGIVYDMAPQSSFHSTAVCALQEALRGIFSSGCTLRVQMPLALGDDAEPEPDLAVVPGRFEDYAFAHPSTALLVAEVADSSLVHDRRRKGPLYARNGIPEFWLVDLTRKTLEVHRQPEGGIYRSRTLLAQEDSVSPLLRPDAVLAVASLFPWG